MPGYSGTPLPKKLGIKPGFRVSLLNMPAEVRTELREALAGCQIVKGGATSLDFIFLFSKSLSEFTPLLRQAAKSLAPAGMLWASWPKKTSGITTDLNENIIREMGLKAGLVDIKVCAVTDVWSGLKFVIPVKDRSKKTGSK